MRVFIGMETSGALRRAFQALGHNAISCDRQPAEDTPAAAYPGGNSTHWQGDVFDVLAMLSEDRPFDLAIFHPDCTYLTNSAEWAYKEPPYHQNVKLGTRTGHGRRIARETAIDDVRRILALDIEHIVVENPIGVLSTVIRKPDQIVQPWQFGDDASRATCFWFKNLKPLKLNPALFVAPRLVDGKKARWANQTDSGQ